MVRTKAILAIVAVSAAALLAACSNEPDPGAAPVPTADAAICPSPDSELAKAAKAEGTVAMVGSVSTAQVDPVLPPAFEATYGVKVQYATQSGSALTTKLTAERAAGQYTLDVFTGGGDTGVNRMLKNGWIGSLSSVLDPKLVQDSLYTVGKAPWIDPDKDKLLQISQYMNTFLFINTNLVKEGDIKSWESLLDPKWQGKIVTDDPRTAGAGANDVGILAKTYGEDFVRKLYVDQKVVVMQDQKAEVDSVGRGAYAIGISMFPTFALVAVNDGLPVKMIVPTGAPQQVLGGSGVLAISDKPPHPNAAKLLANWLACPQGNQLFNKAAITPSSLKAVPSPAGVWSEATLKEGTTYFDAYSYEFLTTGKPAAQSLAKSLLGNS